MYQRQMRTSMGAFWRPLIQELPATSNCCARSFHLSARRLEDPPASSPPTSSPPTSASPPQRETRQDRARNVLRKIDNLQADPRPARLVPPPGRINPDGRPQTQRLGGVATPSPPGTMVRAPPGVMARAPAGLRITRTIVGGEGDGAVGAPRSGPGRGPGPNLGRRGGPGFENRSVGRGGESGPKRRVFKKDEKGDKGRGARSAGPNLDEQLSAEDGLSDGMVQHLLRLQRKEWDKVQYEPKYAHGSQAAKKLIEEGKKLFEGEVPPPKKRIWGRLEKRIGIVGMHGA